MQSDKQTQIESHKDEPIDQKIKKIDKQIKESEQIALSLQNQGQKLDEKLNEITEQVQKRKVLQDVNKNLLQQKRSTKPDLEQMPQDVETQTLEWIQKELENADKQIKYYKKELDKCKDQGNDKGGPVKKIFQLEELLVRRNQEIEYVSIEIKNLEKIKRDQEKQIINIQTDSEIVQEINNLRRESIILKDKIQKLQLKKEGQGNLFVKKEEMMHKIKEKCQFIGVSNTLPQIQPSSTKSESTTFKKKQTVREIREQKDQLFLKKVNLSNFIELKQLAQSLQIRIEQNQKLHDFEVKRIQEKIQHLLEEQKQYQQKIVEKEKRRELAEIKYNDYKKIVRAKTVKPIQNQNNIQKQNNFQNNDSQIKKNQIQKQKDDHQKQKKFHQLNDIGKNSSKIEDNDQSSQENNHSNQNQQQQQQQQEQQIKQQTTTNNFQYLYNTGKRGTQRQIIGNLPSSILNSNIVDDVDILGDKNVDHFLIKLTIFYTDNQIHGFQSEYFCNGEIQQGGCALETGLVSKCQQKSIDLDIERQIEKIEGTYNEQGIQSIKIEDSDKLSIQIGTSQEEDQTFSHQYSKNNQIITTFYGQVNNKLTFFGVETKQEE